MLTSLDRCHRENAAGSPSSRWIQQQIEEDSLQTPGLLFNPRPMSYEFHHQPEEFVTENIMDAAIREIADYAVLLASDGQSCGSGTLVLNGSVPGILTAAHVIDHVMDLKSPTFELVIAQTLHRLPLEKKYLSVKRRRGDGDPANGPDLAFVPIADHAALGQLKAKKSFVPVAAAMAPIFEAIANLDTALCFVAGAPAELDAEEGTRGTSSHILVQKLFFGRTQVAARWSDGDFDYLGCEIIAGAHGFPHGYGGVSGGGVWHVPLAADPARGQSSLESQKPELIGVAYFQTELHDGGRTIRAHGTRALKSFLSLTTG